MVMAEDNPNSVGMAIGEMKGQLTGVMQMLTQQNITASDLRKEIAENKKEVMGYLKNTYDTLQAHVKEDAPVHNTVAQLVNWQQDTQPKVDTLWDNQNREKGWLLAMTGIGSIVGGGIVAAIEWFRR
jgi:phage shock protein A